MHSTQCPLTDLRSVEVANSSPQATHICGGPVLVAGEGWLGDVEVGRVDVQWVGRPKEGLAGP